MNYHIIYYILPLHKTKINFSDLPVFSNIHLKVIILAYYVIHSIYFIIYYKSLRDNLFRYLIINILFYYSL